MKTNQKWPLCNYCDRRVVYKENVQLYGKVQELKWFLSDSALRCLLHFGDVSLFSMLHICIGLTWHKIDLIGELVELKSSMENFPLLPWRQSISTKCQRNRTSGKTKGGINNAERKEILFWSVFLHYSIFSITSFLLSFLMPFFITLVVSGLFYFFSPHFVIFLQFILLDVAPLSSNFHFKKNYVRFETSFTILTLGFASLTLTAS